MDGGAADEGVNELQKENSDVRSSAEEHLSRLAFGKSVEPRMGKGMIT
jgi:hypothetical protein